MRGGLATCRGQQDWIAVGRLLCDGVDHLFRLADLVLVPERLLHSENDAVVAQDDGARYLVRLGAEDILVLFGPNGRTPDAVAALHFRGNRRPPCAYLLGGSPTSGSTRR